MQRRARCYTSDPEKIGSFMSVLDKGWYERPNAQDRRHVLSKFATTRTSTREQRLKHMLASGTIGPNSDKNRLGRLRHNLAGDTNDSKSLLYERASRNTDTASTRSVSSSH